jgi:hypothetical protein
MAIRSTVHAAYLRWLLPIIVLLIMATALILGPALFTHAAGTGNTTTTPSTKPANTAPAKPSQSSPNIFWAN